MKDGRLKQTLLKILFSVQDAKRLYHVRKHYGLKIMTEEETVAYIKRNNCSVARYGDGELQIMLQMGEPTFQKSSAELAEGLRRVFREASPEILLCMPGGLVSTKDFQKSGVQFWEGWARIYQEKAVSAIREILGGNYCFGDANLSRPFSPYKTSEKARVMFPLLKELWEDRDVLFVEGAQTRLGVGNDLFSNTRSIKRILCPAENAFDAYDRILETTVSCWQGELVILALGPTATVLASDLAHRGIQTLDMGHIDIQYEWFLSGNSFQPVQGKYTNETVDGRQVDSCEDEVYLSQIIAEVK